MMDELAQTPELYHPDILALAQNPARWRKEHEAQYIINAYNPVCGDKFEIRLDLNADGIISDTSFFGYGCVVSKGSTAVLAEILVGQSIEEARRGIERYIEGFNSQLAMIDSRLESFRVARKYPGRMQCVLLSWESLLRNALFNHSSRR